MILQLGAIYIETYAERVCSFLCNAVELGTISFKYNILHATAVTSLILNAILCMRQLLRPLF